MTAPLDLGAVPRRARLAVEASAGTGKTYSLASLATAYLADGVAASELLAVTFTRAATAELRSRIRSRMAQVAEHLEQGTSPPDGPDPLLERLRGDAQLHGERLRRALREIDAATITTIHGFATQVLSTLGATAGTDLDARLVDQGDELVVDVCADVLAMASTDGTPAAHLPTLRSLVEGTHAARSTADLLIEPQAFRPEADPRDVVLAGLVQRSVDGLRGRRRSAGTLSFDDVLVELRTALRGDGSRAVVEALQRRFQVALIDEFQDTDPVQWEVFRTVFGEAAGRGDGALVLVGDPKQAIYSFRGANVHTYLEAVGEGSTQRAALDRSWRSDGALLRGLGALFEGTTFGDEQIAFSHVQAVPANEGRRLVADGQPATPVRLRVVHDAGLKRYRGGIVVAGAAQACFQDLVTQVRGLLDHGMLPEEPSRPERPVRPSDVAVLVRSNADAEAAQQALVAQGVPAVLARSGSVLDSEAAMHWRWLLEAMSRPSDPRRTRAYALSWFEGWSAAQVDDADDHQLAALQEKLRRWVEVLLSRGTTRFVRAVWADTGVQARVLGHIGGDRAATDLAHVAEILQLPSAGTGASVTGLITLLDKPPIDDPEADQRTELAARRVETEASAVQVMTVWVSKGLEFPVVCCPTLWRAGAHSPARYQDEELDRRALDLSRGKGWPSKEEAKERLAQIQLEEQGEHLRLLYVALTRARHQTLLWWSPANGSQRSALARLLFHRDEQGRLRHDDHAVALPDEAETVAVLQPLVDASTGAIGVEEVPAATPPDGRWVDPEQPEHPPATSVAVLDATPDRTRRRWSFSAITSEVETTHFDPFDDSLADRGTTDEVPPEGVEVQGDEVQDDDERVGPDDDAIGIPPPDEVVAEPGPFDLLPASAAIGSLVHHVFEGVDFAADPLEPALSDELGSVLSWFPLDLTPVVPGATAAEGRALLVQAMADSVRTPFGGDLGDLALSDVPPEDRLVELAFELLLGEEGRTATDRDLGAALLHHLPEDDPVRPWASGLARGAFGVDLAGHLTGAIDLIFRVPGPDGAPRFVVADYKTNRLHPYGEAARSIDYAPDALARAMAEHHYPLQALLYSVALHRYLRWRLPGYEPEVHLGGIAYLFLRGMTGPDVVRTEDGRPHGVFRWSPPAALITDVSDLLAGRVGVAG
jgi:exodeoxyribonuclease V beta subunit